MMAGSNAGVSKEVAGKGVASDFVTPVANGNAREHVMEAAARVSQLHFYLMR